MYVYIYIYTLLYVYNNAKFKHIFSIIYIYTYIYMYVTYIYTYLILSHSYIHQPDLKGNEGSQYSDHPPRWKSAEQGCEKGCKVETTVNPPSWSL